MHKIAPLKLTIAFLLAGSACTDEESATTTLKGEGYTAIKLGGHDAYAQFRHPLLCYESLINSKFEATDKSGQRVTGVVCNQVFTNNIVVEGPKP